MTAVLDMIPHAERNLEQFVADGLGVVNRVHLPAEFHPPEIALAQLVRAIRQLVVAFVAISPRGRNERARACGLARLDEAAHSHGLAVSSGRLNVFAKLPGRFPTHSKLGA